LLLSFHKYFGITYVIVQLARRLFYSFAKHGADYIVVEDIERFFPTPENALAAFALFDQDNNGDVSREELEAACL
jgi:Ca2+-binding EF-hand superfamily protein